MVLALADEEILSLDSPSLPSRRSASWAKVAAVAGDGLALLVVQVLVLRAIGLRSLPEVAVVVAAGPMSLLCVARHDLYRTRFVRECREERRRLLRAWLTAATITLALAGVLGIGGTWLTLLLVGEGVALSASRLVARAVFGRRRRRGLHRHPTVVVGTAEEVAAIVAALEDATLGYDIVGAVDPAPFGLHLPGAGDRAAALAAAIRRSGATGVVLAAHVVHPASTTALLRELADAGLHVEVSSGLRDLSTRRLSVCRLGRLAALHVEPTRRHGWRAGVKRGIDILGAVAGLVLLAPVMVVVAIAVKRTSPGPVLFRQERVGRHGEPFPMLKFRTMFVASEAMVIDLRETEDPNALFKPARDPRVTSIGRVLRRLSIDELPQLWNVLRGEMSLVGPRPALASEMGAWSPELHGRLCVRPGITGLWQVDRQDWSFEHYERLDLHYVDNWSLSTDLQIIGRTIPAMLFGRSNR